MAIKKFKWKRTVRTRATVQELPSRRFPVLATILPPERRQCFRRLHITDVATVFSAVTNVVLIVIGTASEYAFLSLMKVINWRRNLATSEAKGHLFLTESWGYCSDLGGQRSATTYSLAYKRVRDRKRRAPNQCHCLLRLPPYRPHIRTRMQRHRRAPKFLSSGLHKVTFKNTISSQWRETILQNVADSSL